MVVLEEEVVVVVAVVVAAMAGMEKLEKRALVLDRR